MEKCKIRPFVIKHNYGFEIVFSTSPRKAFTEWSSFREERGVLTFAELQDVGFVSLRQTHINSVWEPTYGLS